MNFYKQASSILDCVAARKGTVKSLTLADDVKDKKRMYALVCETLKHKNTIAELIDKSKILQAEKKLTHSLALVLIHDLLFRDRGLQLSDGPLKQSVLRHKARLSAELTRIKIRAGVKAVGDLVPECQKKHVLIPRYARVNTLKLSVDDALKKLRDDGFVLEDKVEKPDNLAKRSVRRDFHLPDLLLFSPGTDLHDHPMYLSGELILQDKASCFPAHVLFSDPFLDPDNPPDVIDACAAPGNKTTHAAALMNDRGKLWAFDLDAKRLGTLKQMLAKAGCKAVEARRGSFLDTDPASAEYAKVEFFIVDPSCSGSGIVSRLDHLIDENVMDEATDDAGRLRKLADFQVSVVRHAMKFPTARRIVYSTCSVNSAENEGVVKRVLDSDVASSWTLAPRSEVLPSWNTRGEADVEGFDAEKAECVVRARPAEDYTNGFFVACFVNADYGRAVAENGRSAQGSAAAPDRKSGKKRKIKKRESKPPARNEEAGAASIEQASKRVKVRRT